MKRSKSKSKSKTKGKSRRRSLCQPGYVRSKITGKCVFATGNIGRNLNKKRAAVKKSHRRSGRASPNYSATLFSVGTVRTGGDGQPWIVRSNSKGVKQWRRV